jgi:NAD(P)H-flavin reductase/hemoglobin-like flavoprotein
VNAQSGCPRGSRWGFRLPEQVRRKRARPAAVPRTRAGSALLADPPVAGPSERIRLGGGPLPRPDLAGVAGMFSGGMAAIEIKPEVIRRSLENMTADAQKCAGDFYGYLFTGCPHLREMFPPMMTVQNERLFAALLRIVSLLGTPDALARYLTQLGRDHRKYGVQPEHYAPVGEALLRTLRRHCPGWDGEMEAAWGAAYAMAADQMVFAAKTAPGPATWQAQVIRHERRSRDLAVLTLQTDQPLPYRAGQYVTVRHPKWPRVWRQFSVANPPQLYGERSIIELHVRAVPTGWVSSALVRDTELFSEVTIGPPAGLMTADALGQHDLVAVAGGTGLAPVKAIVEAVLAGDEAAMAAGGGYRRNIHLFHGAQTPTDLYDMPALHELSSVYPWLQVVPVVDDGNFPGLTGYVADAALDYSGWAGREALIAGPPGMTVSALKQFRDAGFLDMSLHYDELEILE